MKTINELNASHVPVVRIDNSLKQARMQHVPSEKLQKANDMLKNFGLPKASNAHRQAS